MALSREEYLETCKICYKRSFDMKKGLTCSLTKAHANYETDSCPDFVLDATAAEKKAASDAIRKSEEANAATFGLAAFGIKNQIIAGIVIITAALTWLVIGLTYNWLFYYPIIMLFAGLILMIRGFITTSKKMKAKHPETSSDILDDKIY